MPEGDTLYRIATTLQRALGGGAVVEFESVLPQLSRVDHDTPIRGRTIERIHASGKHLLIDFSGDLTLRTHLRMHGSWHIYRRGEKWKRSAYGMRIRIATDEFEAVGFNIPVAEIFATRQISKNRELARLGPDLLAEDADLNEVLRRFRSKPEKTIGEALLDQSIAAGVGNVYKSEILFLERIHPTRKVESIPDDQLTSIITTARDLLRKNVIDARSPNNTWAGFRRTTHRGAPTERLWVYGRGDRPCRHCSTPISFMKQGVDARVTYWCCECQTERR
jgi:endonuclease VIII